VGWSSPLQWALPFRDHSPNAGLQGIPVHINGGSLKALTIIAAIVVAGGSFFQTMPIPGNGAFFSKTASAEDSWRKEFDEVCSRTQDAMVLTTEELRNLVGRCDALKPVIEKLEESHRKVILRRLQMCRELYLFVLETKERK
jgi:hypothetical protein